MKLLRLAQSTVILTNSSGGRILVDPGQYNLAHDRFSVDTFPTAPVIFITHKHTDHYDISIVKALTTRSTPHFITNPEVRAMLAKEGIAAASFSAGDRINVEGFDVIGIQTDHVNKGEVIVNFGLVVSADGVSLYHAGDTRYIDPSLLPADTRAQYLLVPIANRGVTMGIDDAVYFARDLKPSLTIPIHYDSPKDTGRIDPDEFVRKATAAGLRSRILRFNDDLDL